MRATNNATHLIMNLILHIVLPAFLVLLLVDLAAGFTHWAEDAYIREDTPFIGKSVGVPNVIHHHLPRQMIHNSWLDSAWILMLICAALVLGAWALGCLTWHVWLFAALGTNANEVHKWAHRTRRENGPVIAFLQDIRLLQTPRHHAIHHTNPKNTYYCPVTNVLNPVLEKLRFWEGLEWLLTKTIGLNRRADTSLPGHGPAPEWLKECVSGPPKAVVG
jgi:hypothetical protein